MKKYMIIVGIRDREPVVRFYDSVLALRRYFSYLNAEGVISYIELYVRGVWGYEKAGLETELLYQ